MTACPGLYRAEAPRSGAAHGRHAVCVPRVACRPVAPRHVPLLRPMGLMAVLATGLIAGLMAVLGVSGEHGVGCPAGWRPSRMRLRGGAVMTGATRSSHARTHARTQD